MTNHSLSDTQEALVALMARFYQWPPNSVVPRAAADGSRQSSLLSGRVGTLPNPLAPQDSLITLGISMGNKFPDNPAAFPRLVPQCV